MTTTSPENAASDGIEHHAVGPPSGVHAFAAPFDKRASVPMTYFRVATNTRELSLGMGNETPALANAAPVRVAMGCSVSSSRSV